MSILPLYHNVFLALRDQIVNGAYDSRKPLPGQGQLSAEFNVSRGTIRRALDLLEEEGLIERRQGARTYARALSYRASHQRKNLGALTHDKNYLRLLPGDVRHRYEVVKSDRELAKQFGQKKRLGRVVRLRKSRGKPYCLVITFMPLNIADHIDWEKLGDKPVITAAAEAGYDFARVEQAITATVANEEIAAALETPVGSPLLRVSGLFLDQDDNAIMRKDGYFYPESFEYRMTLYNQGT